MRSRLNLRGSSRIVAEFFEYSINSILYQRGIYPAEDFTVVKKYNLSMLVTVDPEVKAYVKKIMHQLHKWLVHGKISKLIVVITDKDAGEVVERWQFDINPETATHNPVTDAANTTPSDDGITSPAATIPPIRAPKTESQIQAEIQAIIRQITASITFLPVLEGRCTFNVLVYADGDAQVPGEWADSDPKEINNGDCERVQLRSFSTNEHRVDTLVAYRLGQAE
ncbi:mitotic spindle checkpoint protein MAD2 [Nadsonia fulvescens var. elongata DSM 6958]|uniref:Mitotic spindle checkpoint protein MAD2 n=1 Tax=Nadsonia fulvescens var. elongata DSM 6958 TaxID=857566 RepID=A0A1E3PM88_9ASCO|nr:mitotic spindle checkpoint protein MAD2 [Nadsonia fulvescens var. elongata DSM 6958]